MVAWHLNEATPMAGLVPSYAIEPDWLGDVCVVAGSGSCRVAGLPPSPQSGERGACDQGVVEQSEKVAHSEAELFELDVRVLGDRAQRIAHLMAEENACKYKGYRWFEPVVSPQKH